MKSNARIQRHNGKILGAVLWIPASVFEKFIELGQQEVEVSFEENRIILEKEEDIGAPTPTPRHPAGAANVCIASETS